MICDQIKKNQIWKRWYWLNKNSYASYILFVLFCVFIQSTLFYINNLWLYYFSILQNIVSILYVCWVLKFLNDINLEKKNKEKKKTNNFFESLFELWNFSWVVPNLTCSEWRLLKTPSALENAACCALCDHQETFNKFLLRAQLVPAAYLE